MSDCPEHIRRCADTFEDWQHYQEVLNTIQYLYERDANHPYLAKIKDALDEMMARKDAA